MIALNFIFLFLFKFALISRAETFIEPVRVPIQILRVSAKYPIDNAGSLMLKRNILSKLSEEESRSQPVQDWYGDYLVGNVSIGTPRKFYIYCI